VNLAAKGDNKSIPARDSWKLSPDAKYVHYCDNETIGGQQLWAAEAAEAVHRSHCHTQCAIAWQYPEVVAASHGNKTVGLSFVKCACYSRCCFVITLIPAAA
jgi:hypothetical protein